MIKTISEFLARYTEKRFKQTPEWQQLQLNLIQLSTPQIYKPSADGNHLVHWERIFDHHSFHYGASCYRSTNPRLSSLSHTLGSLVTEEQWMEDSFDFGRIDSLAASKSFARNLNGRQINASWFPNVEAWGRGMYPTHDGLDSRPYDHLRLAQLTKEDWDNNLAHIHREGFCRHNDIRVSQYLWLDRIECANSGGSHHAAMLIHQMKEQGYQYLRRAELTCYGIDTVPLSKLLEDGYVAFVTASTATCPDISIEPEATELILRQRLVSDVFVRSMGACSPNDAAIYIFHKNDLKVPNSIFESWYSAQERTGRLIPLLSLLNDTLKYCTTPFIHELDRIYLADPFRRSDKALRVLLEG